MLVPKFRNVLFAPEPRRVTSDFPPKLIPVDIENVPGPINTYWFAPQAAMALLMLAAVGLVRVEPHCVRVSLICAEPACDQSTARDEPRMPDQSWPYEISLKQRKTSTTMGEKLSLDIYLFSGRIDNLTLPEENCIFSRSDFKTQKYTPYEPGASGPSGMTSATKSATSTNDGPNLLPLFCSRVLPSDKFTAARIVQNPFYDARKIKNDGHGQTGECRMPHSQHSQNPT